MIQQLIDKLTNFVTGIINTIQKNKEAFSMPAWVSWIGIDGLLHFLCCFTLMIITAPIGIWWAIGLTTTIAVAKEVYDYFIQKDNNGKQVLHDFIFDISGLLLALLWILVF